MPRVTYGSLPADVNDGHVSNPGDVLRLVDSLAGVWQPPVPAELDYRTELNRSGARNPQDIITAVDLLNGAACFDFMPGNSINDGWNGEALPPLNCLGDTRPTTPGGGGSGGDAPPPKLPPQNQ